MTELQVTYDPFTEALIEWIEETQNSSQKPNIMNENLNTSESNSIQEPVPVIGVFTQSQQTIPAETPAAEPDGPAGAYETEEIIYDKMMAALNYQELQARAQHLMDFVKEKRYSRAHLLAALLDR